MQRGVGLFLPELSCSSFLCSLLFNWEREQEGEKFEKGENWEILALERISGVVNTDGAGGRSSQDEYPVMGLEKITNICLVSPLQCGILESQGGLGPS